MPFTSLKLEASDEYHLKADKRESQLASVRFWALIALGVVLTAAAIAHLVYVDNSPNRATLNKGVLAKGMTSGLAAGLLVLVIYAFKSLGALGRHLKKKLLIPNGIQK